jgi:hypothetical protein
MLFKRAATECTPMSHLVGIGLVALVALALGHGVPGWRWGPRRRAFWWWWRRGRRGR